MNEYQFEAGETYSGNGDTVSTVTMETDDGRQDTD